VSCCLGVAMGSGAKRSEQLPKASEWLSAMLATYPGTEVKEVRSSILGLECNSREGTY